MSFFSQPNAAGGSSGGTGGGNGPFSGLSLNTGSPGPSFEKRKSIIDPSTSQRNAPPSAGLLGPSSAVTTSSTTPSLFPTASSAPGSAPGSAPPTAATFSFGKPATTTTSAAAGPSLFGDGTTSTSSAAGGLFSSLPKPAAASGSLFGSGLGPTTSAPFTNLFAVSTLGASSSTNAYGATSTALPAAQPVDQESLKQKVPRDGGHFSSLLERQKKKARLEHGVQPHKTAQLPALNMDLDDLARKAQELGQQDQGFASRAADSRAHYLLAGSGVKPGKSYRQFQGLDSNDSLADSTTFGAEPLFSTENHIRDLRTKGRDAMIQESMQRVYREVDAHIEQSLGVDFEEQKIRIMKHFGLIQSEEDLDNNGTVNSSFGQTPSKDTAFAGTRSAFGRSGMNKSIIGTPGSANMTNSFSRAESGTATRPLMRGQSARDLRDKERLFVEKVQALNQARLRQSKYAIFQEFAQVEEVAAGDSPHQLKDAYRALRTLVNEDDASQPPRERQFASVYLDGDADSVTFKKRLLDSSRRYLEEAFYREVDSMVEKHPREAQLGGRPTVTNKIRAYIRVRASRRDLAPEGTELQQIGDDGDFCWILIFYLLRSGFVKEAAEYVNEDPAFQSTDRRFVSYMTVYANSANRRLSRKLQDMIDGEFQQRAKLAPKGTVDPYRMACYKVIGRCDLQNRSIDVGTSIEDWMWLQFSLAREGTEDLDPCGLDQIQELFNEIGEKHFKAQAESGVGYGTFFLMQILAGMYEKAIDFLHPFNSVSAVHVAIGLSFYGLLRVTDPVAAGNKLMDYTTTNLPTINFVPLVAHYTGSFRTALPVAAVDYLALLCLNSDLKPPAIGHAHTKTCHECLRELCLETREFAKLLGDIRSDGSRVPGAIEQRARIIQIDNREEFLKAITSQSAAIADQRGQIADAVLLYHLCENYDNVIAVLNRALADAISLDLGESPVHLQPLKPMLEDVTKSSTDSLQTAPTSSLSLTQSTSSPVELAKNMITLYNDNAAYYNSITTTNRETCGALLRMLQARAHLESDPARYMTALEELNDVGILPLAAGGNIPSIRASATAFGALPQLLARCAGISVVWAVRAIGGERDKIIRHGSWETGYGGDRDALKEQLASMAKDLMVFAGLVKYKLPARVYDMLTRAGGDVGGY